MSVERLEASAVGPPAFEVAPAARTGEAPRIFDLSSHSRAREALEFGLGVPELGFNIFVVGEDRSGRMTATLDLLTEHAKRLPRPSDWIYLPNFRHPERPRPYRLPAGVGRAFRERLEALLPALRQALGRAFEAAEFAAHLERESAALQQAMGAAFAELNAFAGKHGYAIERTPQGMALRPQPGNEPEALEKLSDAERQRRLDGLSEVRQRLGVFLQAGRQAELKFADTVREARRQTADAALMPLVDTLGAEFGNYPGLARWIVELRNDLADHLDLLAGPAETEAARRLAAEQRYAVNLLVDHGEEPHAPVVLEPTPSYENLFGRFEFRFEGGVAVTDYRHIRAGALHRANDGILVLRAEAIAEQPMVWGFLKASLRDRCIRIEPPHTGGPPLAGATSPHSIPLNVKVVIVGARRWYYTVFSADPDFATYFKIKADIDPEMPAEPQNVALYARLVHYMALRHLPGGIADAAVARLLAEASRWAQHRQKLSARFEQVEDLVAEAAAMARRDGTAKIDAPQVLKMLSVRRLRRSRVEDRT